MIRFETPPFTPAPETRHPAVSSIEGEKNEKDRTSAFRHDSISGLNEWAPAHATAVSPTLTAYYSNVSQSTGWAWTQQAGTGKMSGTQTATFVLTATYKRNATAGDYRGVYGTLAAFHSQLVEYETLWGDYWTRVTMGSGNKQTMHASATNSQLSVATSFSNATGGAADLHVQIRVCADKKFDFDPCSSWWTTSAM